MFLSFRSIFCLTSINYIFTIKVFASGVILLLVGKKEENPVE